jgi:hypothetical protein
MHTLPINESTNFESMLVMLVVEHVFQGICLFFLYSWYTLRVVRTRRVSLTPYIVRNKISWNINL